MRGTFAHPFSLDYLLNLLYGHVVSEEWPRVLYQTRLKLDRVVVLEHIDRRQSGVLGLRSLLEPELLVDLALDGPPKFVSDLLVPRIVGNAVALVVKVFVRSHGVCGPLPVFEHFLDLLVIAGLLQAHGRPNGLQQDVFVRRIVLVRHRMPPGA